MLKKIKRFLRFCFIGAVWSALYFGVVYFVMKWIWKFNIFNPKYWKTISKFWQEGGVIDSAGEYFFVIMVLMMPILWIWGWRKAMKVSIVKIVFFPIFWYNDYQERKYAQAPKAITLKNMGSKIGKQSPQQSMEDMIASRMPKEKEKKDLNSSKIRSSFEEKSRSFHEKAGG
ncbi:MAG: hypothetical protein IJ689_07170 [Alphaproteobacteria bacterium]|nr:hypothetical protein [Alphaproteobacteria bacterium]